MITVSSPLSNPETGSLPVGARTSLFSPCPSWCADGPHPWQEAVEPDTWGRIHESADSAFGNTVCWDEVKRTDGTPVEGAQVDDRVHIWIDANGGGETRLSTPDEVRAFLDDIVTLAKRAFPGFEVSDQQADGAAVAVKSSRPGLERGGTAVRHKVLWTVREVSDATGYAESTVYKWARAGRIPARKVGRRDVRFVPKEVERWAERQRQGGR